MDMYVCIMMHDDILNNFNLGWHDEFKIFYDYQSYGQWENN